MMRYLAEAEDLAKSDLWSINGSKADKQIDGKGILIVLFHSCICHWAERLSTSIMAGLSLTAAMMLRQVASI